jgi:hypothetical protein
MISASTFLVAFVFAVLYLAIGVVVDVVIHIALPIVYWDRDHAMKSHAVVIVTWPYVVVQIIRHGGL